MARNILCTILVIVLLSVLCGCSGSTAEDPRCAEVENGLLPFTVISGEPGFNLAERMQHYQVPGVSLAVIEGGELRWTRHYGVADLRSSAPVTDSTIFNVGSMSKAVTSAIMLSLAREGLIDLNAPVNQQLRSWTLPENDFTRQAEVTPLRLLNHSGGVVFSPGFAYRSENLPTFRQLLEGEPPSRSGPVRVDRVPGTAFQYSNPGYAVLRQLAEDVTGRDFPEIASRRVFEPLGMRHTTFANPLPPELLGSAAMGHRSDGRVDAEVRRWCGHMAAGGLWTSAADYAAFVIELQRSLRGESELVFDQELAELMVEAHDAPEYGLGVFHREATGERRYVGHIGDGPGFVGGFTTDTSGDLGVVVLTNGTGGINLVREIRRAVASVYEWPDNLLPARTVVVPSPGLLDAAAGRYRRGFDAVVNLEHRGDSLWLNTSELPGVRLFAVGESAFVCRERSGEVTIESGPDGEVTHVRYHLSDQHGRLGDEVESLARMAADERIPLEILLEGKTSQATGLYRALLESDPASPAVAENRLNRLGSGYLGQGRPDAAVAVLQLYVDLYPGSANAHDSLGEALMAAGHLDKAVASYRRSLELNPANGKAVEMIEKIESSRASSTR